MINRLLSWSNLPPETATVTCLSRLQHHLHPWLAGPSAEDMDMRKSYKAGETGFKVLVQLEAQDGHGGHT